MPSLKSRIVRYMVRITLCLVIIMLICTGAVQIIGEQRHARENADQVFVQIENFLLSEQADGASKKDEISDALSLLQNDRAIELYAAEPETGIIIGSSEPEYEGINLADVGIDPEKARALSPFHTGYLPGDSYCVFSDISGHLVGYVIKHVRLYQDVPINMAFILVVLVLISALIAAAITRYMQKNVIDNISKINENLRRITEGDLERSVGITQTIDFSELSSHINEMIRSLLAGTDKMSYVLDHSDLNIGVYEYNTLMQKARYTDHVPQILLLTDKKGKAPLSIARDDFRGIIEQLRQHPVADEDDTYELCGGDTHRYIKLHEVVENNETTGIIIDATDQVERRRIIETERDIDKLTGILNRRGLDNSLLKLLQNEDELGHSALIMIDADGLKVINDNYGHENGDIYIKSLADTLASFGQEYCRKYFVSRCGGDEFVVFIYGCGSEDELMQSIEALAGIQDKPKIMLTNGESVQLRFSAGHCIRTPDISYEELFKIADERMYAQKRERKKKLAEQSAAGSGAAKPGAEQSGAEQPAAEPADAEQTENS